MMYDAFDSVTVLDYGTIHNQDGLWDVYNTQTCEIFFTCNSKVRAIERLIHLAYGIETFEVYDNGDIFPIE